MPVWLAVQVGDRAGGGGDVRRACAGAGAAIAELLALTEDFKEEVSWVRFVCAMGGVSLKPSSFPSRVSNRAFCALSELPATFLPGWFCAFAPHAYVRSSGYFGSMRVLLQALLVFVCFHHARFFPTLGSHKWFCSPSCFCVQPPGPLHLLFVVF